jgi:hypothetical protein
MKQQPPATAFSSRALADIPPLERGRKIAVREAAALNDVSEATFRRHYGHLIRKIGLRRDVVELGDAIDLPPPGAKSAAGGAP